MTLFGIIEKWDSLLYSLINVIEYLFYILKYPKLHSFLKKNKKFKDIHKGERCFIVLNGPSVNQHNLSNLENEYVIATNYFFRAPLCQQVKPNYYCWLDSKAVVSEDAPSLISEIRGACPEAELFINAKGHKMLSNIPGLHFVYTKHIANAFSIRYNLAGVSSSYLTVAFMALEIALYMGFKDIYFLGLDFEPSGFTHFTRLGDNTDCIKPGKESEKGIVAGHYWGYTLAQYQAYYLSHLARKLGRNVVNLNPQSYIRAFDFSEYEQIINKKQSNG